MGEGFNSKRIDGSCVSVVRIDHNMEVVHWFNSVSSLASTVLLYSTLFSRYWSTIDAVSMMIG